MYARKDACTGRMDSRRENQVDKDIELKAAEELQPSRRLRVRDGFSTCLRAVQS